MVPPRGLTWGSNCVGRLRDDEMYSHDTIVFLVFIRIYDGFSFVVVYDHYPRIGWHNLLLEDTATSPL
jgi:hypothetical protein